MKTIGRIRSHIRLKYRAIEKIRATIVELQKESLDHLGADPDAAVHTGDERLAVAYAFGAYLGIVAELLEAALKDLEKIKDIKEPEARALIEQWRTESDDSDLEGA